MVKAFYFFGDPYIFGKSKCWYLYNVDVIIGCQGKFHNPFVRILIYGSEYYDGYWLIFFSLVFISYIISNKRALFFTDSAGLALSIIS